jgi:NAD(P)-dependent dehydrogenase (short-subunit alcohol dehydrogenase family)
MGDLSGKVALITGAGRMRSIGHDLALAFARAGADVAITGTGRDPSTYPEDEKRAGWRDIESVADGVRALGRRGLPIVADVSRSEDVETMLARTLSELGRIDFLINNAAFARGPDRVPVVDLSEELWRKVIDIKLTGAFLASKAVATHLIKQGEGGRIINISSVAGKVFPGNAAAYAAANAGIQSLAASMSKELGRYGITCNTVCPGLIDTQRVDDIRQANNWDASVSRIPVRRAGTGDDIANLVIYLCSSEGSFINGQSINVDGGHANH